MTGNRMNAMKQSRGFSKAFTMLRAYTVFNVDQCENLPAKITTPEPIKPRHTDELRARDD